MLLERNRSSILVFKLEFLVSTNAMHNDGVPASLLDDAGAHHVLHQDSSCFHVVVLGLQLLVLSLKFIIHGQLLLNLLFLLLLGCLVRGDLLLGSPSL